MLAVVRNEQRTRLTCSCPFLSGYLIYLGLPSLSLLPTLVVASFFSLPPSYSKVGGKCKNQKNIWHKRNCFLLFHSAYLTSLENKLKADSWVGELQDSNSHSLIFL